MTTGSKTLDGRIWYPNGNSRIGRIYQKVWSGADYPKVKPSTKNVYDKRGRFLWTRTYWPRAPKRARIEEHGYTCYGTNLLSNSNPLQVKYTGSSGNPYYYYSTQTAVGVWTPPDDWWTTNDDIALLGKLRTAVAGSDFNLGVTLGEGKQTLKMIGDNAIAIARSISHAKRGNFKKAIESLNTYKKKYAVTWSRDMRMRYDSYGRPLGLHYAGQYKTRKPQGLNGSGTASQSWLELQYGWIPLLQDVKAGAESLAHNLSVPASFTVKVRRDAGGQSGQKYVVNVGGSSIFYFDAWGRVSKQIKAILSEDVTRIAQLSGIYDPASVAWELLPWSFVIDWFVPIGNYLAARGLAQALSKGKYVTTFRRIGTIYGPARAYAYYLIHPTDRSNGYLRLNWRLDRTVTTNIEVPLPSVKGLNQIASWKHAANAVALLAGFKKD